MAKKKSTTFALGDEVRSKINPRIRGHIVAIEQYVCRIETKWQPEPVTVAYDRIELVPAGE